MSKKFADMGLSVSLLESLDKMGFDTATPIQEQAIPAAMEGRDVLGSAQTGTGKTGAFSIPMIMHLMENPKAMGVILTPTRELAVQVMKALHDMRPMTPKLFTALLIGGESMQRQLQALRRKPQIIIGTPGRINDHLRQGTLKLDQANFLVLDEMDRMLDMGFGIQVDDIVKHMPNDRQTLMFSATMPPNIQKMAKKYLENPERISVGVVNKPMERIELDLVHTKAEAKYSALMNELDKRTGSVIVFVKTKRGADKMAQKLKEEKYGAVALHGDLKQRQRDRVTNDFRRQKFRILIATDVAARGLDIPHIKHVINYDLPQCPEDYIHRVGRTARAGAEGFAVCLLTPQDTFKWKAIQKLIDPDAAAEEEQQNKKKNPRKQRGQGGRGRKPQGDQKYSHKKRRHDGENKGRGDRKFAGKKRRKDGDDNRSDDRKFSNKRSRNDGGDNRSYDRKPSKPHAKKFDKSKSFKKDDARKPKNAGKKFTKKPDTPKSADKPAKKKITGTITAKPSAQRAGGKKKKRKAAKPSKLSIS